MENSLLFFVVVVVVKIGIFVGFIGDGGKGGIGDHVGNGYDDSDFSHGGKG